MANFRYVANFRFLTLAGESPEERVNTWFTHFRKLLGNTPEVEEPDETIPAVYEGLDIDDGPFTLDQFKRVKTSLKLGKSAGLVFMKGLRLSQVLGLNPVLKLRFLSQLSSVVKPYSQRVT